MGATSALSTQQTCFDTPAPHACGCFPHVHKLQRLASPQLLISPPATLLLRQPHTQPYLYSFAALLHIRFFRLFQRLLVRLANLAAISPLLASAVLFSRRPLTTLKAISLKKHFCSCATHARAFPAISSPTCRLGSSRRFAGSRTAVLGQTAPQVGLSNPQFNLKPRPLLRSVLFPPSPAPRPAARRDRVDFGPPNACGCSPRVHRVD